MRDKIHLIVLTPYGRYFEGDVDFLSVRSEKYSLGIYPNHAPLISTVDICKGIIRMGNLEKKYAIGGGVIHIEEDKTTLIVNSIESKNEIDIKRAEESKKRAEERLSESKENTAIDVNRAKLSLLRAINRLDLDSDD